jgi:hypothetical protein
MRQPRNGKQRHCTAQSGTGSARRGLRLAHRSVTRFLGALLGFLATPCFVRAQDERPAAAGPPSEQADERAHAPGHVTDRMPTKHSDMNEGATSGAMHGGHDPGALMTGPLGISRTRVGSGTAWLPDSSPMYALMGRLGAGGFMFHENVFVGYDWFGSDRGSQRFISVNSIMAMAWQPVGPGELTGRLMLSAEPLTVGKGGYPLIFQTGETFHGQPLHDRQHPHDLFMEVALNYVLPISEGIAVEVYVAPVGEPALGPVAYPHRISAASDPLAPIGHHWTDSTHISFGVLTAGIYTRHFKLEGSWFNGREPDENRWDFDLDVPDSYSGRITWNSMATWSVQGSYGYLRSPERSQPGVALHRATGSVTYNAALSSSATWATTVVGAANFESKGPATPATLLESTWSIDGHHTLFGRAEYVRKTGHDLVLRETLDTDVFNVALLGLGYAHYFGPFASLESGIGVRGAIGIAEPRLESFYGTQVPIGGIAFVQLRPAPMSM